MSLFLGVDVGTQGLKAVVYDSASQKIRGMGSFSYEVLPTDVKGRAEQHPSTWIEALREAVKAATAGIDATRIGGIGVSGQQHGMVLLDEEFQVIRNAKLWCDVEAAKEAEEISRQSGVSYPAGFTAPKLLWVKRNEPATWEKTRHVLLPHDYVNFYLTGRICMECGDASGTALLDVAARRWDKDAASRIDPSLVGWLPELIGPNEVVGKLLPNIARELGLSSQVIVSPGGGDNMMSALGAGAVRDGVWVISLGTSATMFGHSGKPIVDPTGAWLPLLCIMNCTAVAEEARQASGLSREEITRLAAEVSAGCGGVNFLPYLTGERTPNWPHATGALLGLRPGSISRPGVTYRAALEGIAFALLAGMQRLKDYGCQVQELRLVGGGSNSSLWCQIISDVFEVPVLRPVEGAETAALGAALQAAAVHSNEPIAGYIMRHGPGMQDEVMEPNPSNFVSYHEAFHRHVQLGKLLFK